MGEDIGGEMAFRAFGHLVSSSFRPLTTVWFGQRNQLNHTL
jgi:hypothetical protein